MNFMTLQRPTYEEMERRRMLRDGLSPQRSTTLQRKESMLSRGFNAIMRRQSISASGSRAGVTPGASSSNGLRRNDSFFMHSTLVGREDSIPPLSMLSSEDDSLGYGGRHPLHTIVPPQNRGRPNLGRAKSFKYPERISQIPPAEFTRIRSKSQVRDTNNNNFHNLRMTANANAANNSSGEDSGGIYTTSGSGSGKSTNIGPTKKPNLARRETMYLNGGGGLRDSSRFPETPGYGAAAAWLAREKFFQQQQQQQQRILPRPQQQQQQPRGGGYLRERSEPPPVTRRRQPLPDFFFYGDRWQEQESRARQPHHQSRPQPPPPAASDETPEPPPGTDLGNGNNNTNINNR